MRMAQRILLAAFAVSSLATVVLQIRYGMICGRTEYTEKQDDPRAKSCHRKAGAMAGIAAVCLAVCMVLGVLAR